MNYHYNKDFTFIHTEQQKEFAIDIFQDNNTGKYFFDNDRGNHFDTLNEVIQDAQKTLYNNNKTTTT